MAGREGGGGVVGQSHSNSERQQTATYGGTDRDGPQQTLNFFHLNCCFVLYHLFFYQIFYLIFIFQLFLLYQLTSIFLCTILYHYKTWFLYHSLCVN